ncbi:MAG: ABC transporter permease [Chitinophagales bacterium]
MNLLKLSWHNLIAKPLATALSLILLILGVGIISVLLLVNTQLTEQFNKNIKGIDMVVGAKGSPLQLILSSVYHIDSPTGNISYNAAMKLAKNRMVQKSIPLAYGDSYEGYRIVGTTNEYTQHYEAELQKGVFWKSDFEVTVGATVARNLKLKVGDTFHSSHGLTAESLHKHENESYKVVGILSPNASVLDQLILTSIASVWAIHEEHTHEKEETTHAHHEHLEGEHSHEHQHETQEDKDITAMLLSFRPPKPMGFMQLPRLVNQETNMQAALPAIEVHRLFDNLGIGFDALRIIALLIIVISGLSIFISLYNSLKDRKYELALMRSMGASPFKLFTMIMLESLFLCFIGYILGVLSSRLMLYFLNNMLPQNSNYYFNSYTFLNEELLLLVSSLIIGFVAALLPAMQAFKTDISKTLANV